MLLNNTCSLLLLVITCVNLGNDKQLVKGCRNEWGEFKETLNASIGCMCGYWPEAIGCGWFVIIKAVLHMLLKVEYNICRYFQIERKSFIVLKIYMFSLQ